MNNKQLNKNKKWFLYECTWSKRKALAMQSLDEIKARSFPKETDTVDVKKYFKDLRQLDLFETLKQIWITFPFMMWSLVEVELYENDRHRIFPNSSQKWSNWRSYLSDNWWFGPILILTSFDSARVQVLGRMGQKHRLFWKQWKLQRFLRCVQKIHQRKNITNEVVLQSFGIK